MKGELKNVGMRYSADGKQLTIVIDLTEDLGPSSTGKTRIVATTSGNVEIKAPGGRGDMRLGVNLYEYPARDGS